jgi:hypothetical protein
MTLRIIATLALVLSGCSTFQLLDTHFRPNGKTLAVISALSDDTNLLAAKLLTESIARDSFYRVMSQKQIAETISNYPLHIRGPYQPAYLEVEEDFSRTDFRKLAEIQKRLGVDYLYVIWMPTAIKHRTAIMRGANPPLQMFTQLIAGGSVVGRGNYRPSYGKRAVLLRKDLDVVAKELVKTTMMWK